MSTEHGKREKGTEFTVHEDSVVRLNLKGLWALVLSVFICGGVVVKYQLSTDYKIERMYLQNEQQHSALMLQIQEMSARQEMFVLRKQVEDALVFAGRWNERVAGKDTVDDEVEFRQKLQSFLK